MKRLLILIALAGFVTAADAAFIYSWDSGFANNGYIPDANTTGWYDTRTVTETSVSEITDVNVTLTVAGGYNGDLYVTLAHSSGFSVLLNRVGRTSGNSFGYSDSGFSIKLDDAAATMTDIHLYQTVSGYSISGGATWKPDARNVSPLTVTDGSTRSAFLSAFNGLDPNGTWTLFVADLSGGDIAQVTSWGLEISAVPEPVNVALGAFGGLLALIGGWRAMRRKASSK